MMSKKRAYLNVVLGFQISFAKEESTASPFYLPFHSLCAILCRSTLYNLVVFFYGTSMMYMSNLMLSDYIQVESVYRYRSVNCIVINICVCRTVVIVYSPRNSCSLKVCFHLPPLSFKTLKSVLSFSLLSGLNCRIKGI